MADLDRPENADEIYDSRGDEVSLARPIFQGDVFDNIILPGLSEKPQRVMILSHPCSMRGRKGRLKEYITAAAVNLRNDSIPLRKWATSHYAVFPLPELDDQDDGFSCVDFNQVGSVRSELFDRRCRVACLSEYGVQLLQQRHVFHYTRVKVELLPIYQQLAPNFTELELGQDWVEALVDLDDDSDLMSRITAAEEDFDAFLSENGNERRQRLKDETRRSGVRTEVRNEIRRRSRKT